MTRRRPLITRLLRIAIAVVAVLAASYLYFATLHPRVRLPDHVYFEKPGPWAIAHRGGRGLWPENTLIAFDGAAALGVDVLEIDLRVSADGVMVALHDATVDRTTDGQGRIAAMSFAEIRKLDAAYRFPGADGQFPYRGQGVRVPTLEEVLARFHNPPRLVVEMKGFAPAQVTQLCRLIVQHEASARVLVASFDHGVMEEFREACPAVATSATWREGLLFYQLGRMHLESLYRGRAGALQVPVSLRGRKLVDQDFLERAARSNIKVDVWTVNDEAEMRRLLDLGVHGIMTDFPDRLLRVMGRLSAAPR